MDILLIALADISRDARTLNAARTLASAGFAVGILAAGTCPAHDGITFHRWEDPGGRAWQRWRSITRAAARLTVRPRLIAAMDFFALQAASVVARSSRARIVYDAREFYFALGPLKGRGIKQRIIAWLESRYIKRVDAVTVSGPLDAKVLQQRYALREPPTVILNAPPYADAVTSTLLRDRCAIPDGHLILVYQGAVLDGRGIAPVLHAMPAIPDVHLCVIGDGSARPTLEQYAQDLGVHARVHWIGAIPYDDLHPWTCSADIGVTLIENVSMSYAYALPNKFFEYMRARIPQLVSDLPALRAMLHDHPVGVLVGSDLSAERIRDAIERLRHPGTRDAFIAQCDDIRQLCYERQANTLLDLYASLLERT